MTTGDNGNTCDIRDVCVLVCTTIIRIYLFFFLFTSATARTLCRRRRRRRCRFHGHDLVASRRQFHGHDLIFVTAAQIVRWSLCGAQFVVSLDCTTRERYLHTQPVVLTHGGCLSYIPMTIRAARGGYVIMNIIRAAAT